MDSTNLTALESLTSPFALISKGTRAIAGWLEERNEQRYQEFIRAALDGDVLPESADAMTSEDLLAMLRALDMDVEAEKASLYGRLARSIANGTTKGFRKRHFIKALSDLSFGQADLLRRALISERYEVFPGAGAGRKEPKEFLGLNSNSSINRRTFERWGMLEEVGLSSTGRQFVEACFAREELLPSAVSFREWANGRIHIVCNEMSAPTCNTFLLQLTEGGHREAIRVLNSAALHGRANRPVFSGSVMVVLLTEDPQRLVDEWTTVEATMQRSALTVVATTDPSIALPAAMDRFERVDASPGRVSEAVRVILARFEEHGFRGS